MDWRTARQKGQHSTENGRDTVRGFGFYRKAKPWGGVGPQEGVGVKSCSALTHSPFDS